MASFFVPLKDLFASEGLPAELLSSVLASAAVEEIGIIEYSVESTEDGVYFQADLAMREGETEETRLELPFPAFPNLAIMIDAAARLEIWFQEAFTFRLGVGALALRFPTQFLKPVRLTADRGWEPDPAREFVEATLDFDTVLDQLPIGARDFPCYLNFSDDGGFTLDLPVATDGVTQVIPVTSLNGPAMIGESGFVVEVEELSFDLNVDDPLIRFVKATITPPPELVSLASLPKLSLEHSSLSRRGFSGRVSADWPLRYDEQNRKFQYHITQNGTEQVHDARIFEIWGGLDHIAISFDQNVPIGVDMTGGLFIPYFDEPVKIRVNIAANGKLTLTIDSEDEEGITLSREELLSLTIQSLSLTKDENNVGSLLISGGIEPLLMSSDGMQWPRLDVTDLYIDSTGKFRIKEAWLDLKDLATLDLWGFHFELRRIGIGYEDADDKLWIDLSGGLRLIEQIPVALDVEGFRIKWPRSLLDGVTEPLLLPEIQDVVSQLEVAFDGIYLFFGVPDAVEFEGLIRFFKEAQIVGFAGDVALRVPASGFAAEAGLLIGLSFVPFFPFLYVYFGVELPAGIPLGQSGLALKGALGMFGLNVAPAKTLEQNWYYDWYKRGPIVGAHPTNKWEPRQNALALGVGVTITTADGYVKGTRGLIVLAIPGPVLMIEGRALILGGLQPGAEPPLRALAVFDGGAGTVQFNVEAEATLIADLLKAYGMLEAFFDFNDLTNWRLYLGQDTPRDRRIRADILKFENSFLFKADAYLMIDMVGGETLRSRIGASIGFEPKVPKIDPLDVEFSATLEGKGLVTTRPDQFSGQLDLEANIKLSTFGVSVRLSADAEFLTEGPKPFKVGAHVHVEAEMPDPLDPVEATVEFEWTAPTLPRVESPLAEIDIHSRLAPRGAGFQANALTEENRIHPLQGLSARWERLAQNSPTVEVDSKPIICFTQKMNSNANSFVRDPSGSSHHYDVGLFQFFPGVLSIRLYEHRKRNNDVWSANDRDWELIAATDQNGGQGLPGVWLVNSEPESPEAPSPRQVQLWTDNPLASASRALGYGYSQFQGAIQSGKALAERILDDHPGLMKCDRAKAQSVCVDFAGVKNMAIEPGESWEHKNLLIHSTIRTTRVRTAADGVSPAISATGFAASITDMIQRGSSWVADALFDRAKDTCLVVDGYVVIKFRERVKRVRITFCQPSKLSEIEIKVRVTTKRGIRFMSELSPEAVAEKKTITLKDIRGCTVTVRSELSVSAEEWNITADQGFDCIHIIRMDQFAIREICYTTVAETERASNALAECKQNGDIPFEPRVLQPGAYYRLDVTTRVRGELPLDDLPIDEDSLIGEMLTAAYEALGSALTAQVPLPKLYHQTCFFQTESPPANLRPYVKWCSPPHQFERFFYGDDLAIRFLRSNLRGMFNAPFALRAQIRDSEGHLIEGYSTNWDSSRSSTLFTEESVWEQHRSGLGWSPREIPHDDLLLIRRDSGAKGLSPRSRYQLEIVGAGGARDWNQLTLFSSSFTTSGFESFNELVRSYSRQTQLIANSDISSDFERIAGLQESGKYLAKAQWDWERAEVDFRFETLPGGRKGLEDAKIRRREAAATHEEKFRALAERLANLYFVPFSDKLDFWLIREPIRKDGVALWLRSPESLDVRLRVFESPNAPESPLLGQQGRTTIKLSRLSPSPRNSKIVILPNADSTQVLILPFSGETWGRGTYLLSFEYERDYGDETQPIDHRYDRPVEFAANDSSPVGYSFSWQV